MSEPRMTAQPQARAGLDADGLARLAADWDMEAISAGTYSAHTLRRCAERLRAILAARSAADGASE